VSLCSDSCGASHSSLELLLDGIDAFGIESEMPANLSDGWVGRLVGPHGVDRSRPADRDAVVPAVTLVGHPPTFKHEHEQVVADGELVIVHSRFSGFGQAKNWIVADFVRVVDGLLVEHWDVVEDEASQAESKSGNPMFGDGFPV
jgi:hypothetical protein